MYNVLKFWYYCNILPNKKNIEFVCKYLPPALESILISPSIYINRTEHKYYYCTIHTFGWNLPWIMSKNYREVVQVSCFFFQCKPKCKTFLTELARNLAHVHSWLSETMGMRLSNRDRISREKICMLGYIIFLCNFVWNKSINDKK